MSSTWGVKHVIAVDPASYMHPLLDDLLCPDAQRADCVEAMGLTAEQLKGLGKQERARAVALREAPQFESLRKVAGGDSEVGGEKPAPVQPRPRPRIDHWRVKAEEALVQENDERLSGLYTDSGIFVCDMNVPCEDTVAVFARFLELRGRYIASNKQATASDSRGDEGSTGSNSSSRKCTLVVLTFKNTTKSTWLKQKAASIRRLTDELLVENLQELHLFANTRNETTLVGEFVHRHPQPPQPPS
jgi:hypothetical protein